ncbi:MAG TPA: ROK family transcriptional regulator [Roseiflexaceae bacterium]|nr:ROK family transcriptional regulator [Roseiflexaceae bacterium]
MRRLRPGSKQVIRDINRTIILNLIKQHGTISRVQLADLSSLASPTITEIVAALLDERLIIETGSLISDRRGPRPVLLELNRQGGYAVGIMLRPDGMNLVVTDLMADVVYRAYQPLPANVPPSTVLEIVAHSVRKQITTAQIDWSQIRGLGVGVTGVIDSTTGICHEAYILGWHDVRIGETLEAKLGIPVHVDNDTRTLTVAEQHFGISYSRQNFVLVTVGRGVGMGAVVNGELLRGHRDIGAEFGHITMSLDGPLCQCGKRGCLEAIASDVGIVAAASAAGLAAAEQATIEAITERAHAGDAGLRQIFHAAGVALGLGVAHLINIFGPELVVLTGEGLRAGDLLLNPLHQTLAQSVFGDRLRHTEIAVKPWAPDWEPWARGAASLVLDDLLRPPLYTRRPIPKARSAEHLKGNRVHQ